MIVTALIVGISLALFVYWFRYTVIIILSNRRESDYAHKVAAANHLSFVDVRQQLHGRTSDEKLPGLFRALQRDYRVLKYLLGHAATIETGSYTAEQRLLMVNFRMMGVWFYAVRRFRPQQAKHALLEMSGTLEYFANIMGRRFATLAAESAPSGR
jgi:hypothetical protein